MGFGKIVLFAFALFAVARARFCGEFKLLNGGGLTHTNTYIHGLGQRQRQRQQQQQPHKQRGSPTKYNWQRTQRILECECVRIYVRVRNVRMRNVGRCLRDCLHAFVMHEKILCFMGARSLSVQCAWNCNCNKELFGTGGVRRNVCW